MSYENLSENEEQGNANSNKTCDCGTSFPPWSRLGFRQVLAESQPYLTSPFVFGVKNGQERKKSW